MICNTTIKGGGCMFVSLFVRVLWYVNNVCSISNDKSIFIQINSPILDFSVKHKYTVRLSKTFLFHAIQFSPTVLIKTIRFSISLVLFTHS